MISPKARIITSLILTSDVQLSLEVGIKSGPILATESEVEPLGRRSRKAFFSPSERRQKQLALPILYTALIPGSTAAILQRQGGKKETKS